MPYCSPNNPLTTSCYTKLDLYQLAKSYNNWVISYKKKRDLIDLDLDSDTDILWNKIHTALYDKCKTEYCWINLEFINTIPDKDLVKRLTQLTFKPISPRGKYSWLSTSDINNIMIQYNVLFDKMNYLGALPCDFYIYTTVNLYDFDKYNYISIILNLDKSNQKGSHWVTLFVDNLVNSIEYFDSVGDLPNKCILNFINKLQKHYPTYTLLQNSIQHQFKNSECGIYSIYYILQRLYGKSFNDISHNIISDNTMNIFRKFLFRPKK